MDNLYRRLLEFTGDGVYRYTFDDGRILLANQGFVDILDIGGTPEALVGRYMKDVLTYTEKAGAIRELLERAGEIHGFEYHFRTLKGADRWVIHDSFLLTNPETGQKEVEAIVKDITERKRVEESLRLHREHLEAMVRDRTAELTAANERLQQALENLGRSNRELEEFAYVASHDLQEPLRKIQAFGDRLQAGCAAELSDLGKDYLARMQNAASRMSRLINDLLAFSRVSTRGAPFAPVDLNRVAAEVLVDLEWRLQQTGGRVDVDGLPTIEADATQMGQLLQNLIGNALKFHRPGAPPVVRVAGEPARRGGRPACRLTVADNGIGFDEKYLDRIFVIFQQLHTRDEYEGTGIGLALCRKIVERHGGSITARSAPGSGATFIVELPIQQEKRE